MRILAISGSLREASSNSRALRALRELASPSVAVALYDELGELPHFNPDLDTDEPPAVVARFRQQVGAADAIVISSPEYAHGIPGSLKNALDWLVSSSEFPGKPVALINTSPRATHAQAQLVEVLTTMAGRIQPQASVTISLPGQPSSSDLSGDESAVTLLHQVIDGLATPIQEKSI